MVARWFVAAAIAIAIPLVSWGAVSIAETSIEQQWLVAVEDRFGDVPFEEEGEVALQRLCGIPEAAADLGDACNDTRLIGMLRTLSIVSLVLSGVLLAGTGAVAVATKGSRERLAALFRPSLLALLLGLAILLVLQSILVIGALFELQSAIAGWFLPGILLGFGAAAIVGTLGVFRAMVAMVRRRPLEIMGIALDPETDSDLFAEVDAIATSLHAARPDVILAGLEPAFFVVDAAVKGLDGRHAGKVMYVSLPLLRILSVEEWRAVIGHELGHFRGKDTEYTRAFSPAYAAGRESLGTLEAATRHWTGWPMVPATKLLEAFFLTLATHERSIARGRELAADQAGAEASTPTALATALIKLHTTSDYWVDTWNDTARAVVAGREVPDVSATYVRRARLGASAVTLSDAGRIQHPFDSHPPLDTRLEALGFSAEALLADAADLDPAIPASNILRACTELETELTERVAGRIREQLGTSTESPASDPAVQIREVAASDPALARIIQLVERTRGADLARPMRPTEPWAVLADVVLETHPEGRPFRSLVPHDDLPPGDQLLVVDLRRVHDARDLILRAGTRLQPIGYNEGARLTGGEEDLYLMTGSRLGPRIVAVRGVGLAPMEHQVAGLLVVPESDPLASPGHDADAMRAAVRDLLKRSQKEPSESVLLA